MLGGAKDHTGKRKRDSAKSSQSQNTTPRKTRKANPEPNSLIQSFRHNAGKGTDTLDNIRTLHSLIGEEWGDAPSMDVVRSSLQEGVLFASMDGAIQIGILPYFLKVKRKR